MAEIHLICNAHIDPVWQWQWEEGAAAAVSSFRAAAERASRSAALAWNAPAPYHRKTFFSMEKPLTFCIPDHSTTPAAPVQAVFHLRARP